MSTSTGEVCENIDIVVDSIYGKINVFLEVCDLEERPIIGRISNHFRGKYGSPFEPQIIAIGPYHGNNGMQEINSRLKPMEDNKMMYLINLCDRDRLKYGTFRRDKLKDYTTITHQDELKARKHYSQLSSQMTSENFVQMLVIDGCFIVEFLHKFKEEFLTTTPMLFRSEAIGLICFDLLLLENQIPFFILEQILAKTNSKPAGCTILDLAIHYLNRQKRWDINKEILLKECQHDTEGIDHLLHLSHMCMVSQLNLAENPNHRYPSNVGPTAKVKMISITATEMNEAGVIFKKKMAINDTGCLDISFKDGTLEIPGTNIVDNTSSMYRNLMALEQSSKKYGNKFTAYVMFMDSLIDTANDVVLLTKSKIISHNFGCAQDVADLFNKLCHGMFFDFNEHYLVNTIEAIDHYCNKPYNKWRANLMHDYLYNPWAIISVMGAFVLLGLTATQTGFSIR